MLPCSAPGSSAAYNRRFAFLGPLAEVFQYLSNEAELLRANPDLFLPVVTAWAREYRGNIKTMRPQRRTHGRR